MKRNVVVFIALLCGASPSLQGDQLAWNSLDVSRRAVTMLKPGSVIALYCSLCNSERIEILEVREAMIMPTDDKELYRVAVFGKRVFESVEAFSPGQYKNPATFRPVVSTREDRADIWVVRQVDLAYAYVPLTARSLRCLGTHLDLEPDVRVEWISLPEDVAVQSGGARVPSK